MRIDLPPCLRSLQELAALFGTRVECQGSPPGEILGIATHSAEVRQGDLFLCLPGKRQNGVAFLHEALSKGASAILAPLSVKPAYECYFLPCEDPIGALLDAAAAYRKAVGARVIAVTGSTGKTTVKEAIAAVLDHAPHSEANYNSLIGMPLSVLALPKASHWVLELGINARGEMRRMAKALSPDVAVITNVGSAHVGELGDFAAILEEKMELARAISHGGTVILPCGVPKEKFTRADCRVICVGEESVKNVRTDEKGTCLDLVFEGRTIRDLVWPIPGRIGVSVLSIVGTLGLLEGVKDEQIKKGLCLAGEHTPRMRRYTVGRRLVLDDTYNASPEAMIASLEVLKILAGERPTVAVLGDMCELGAFAPTLHDAVGVFAAKNGLSQLFTYGEEAMAIASGAKRVGMPKESVFCYREAEREKLLCDLSLCVNEDAVVLVKGSRKMAMEEIIKGVWG